MRQIYIVNATQVVTSENHPEGLYSVMTGYPKTFDSRSYNSTEYNPDGDPEKAFRKAEAAYLTQEATVLDADNPSRAMATITLMRADGVLIKHRCIGSMPIVPPAPQPEPEPEVEAE
jgi:hypothetical protein